MSHHEQIGRRVAALIIAFFAAGIGAGDAARAQSHPARAGTPSGRPHVPFVVADFTYTPPDPIEVDDILLESTSTADPGALLDYDWDVIATGSSNVVSELWSCDATGVTDLDLTCTIPAGTLAVGSYRFRLRLADTTTGDADEALAAVTISELVPTDFTWVPLQPEIGESVLFNITGTSGSIEEAVWNFGGSGCSPYTQTWTCTPGVTSCSYAPYEYASGGTKNVTLVSVTVDGTTQNVNVTHQVSVLNTGSCGSPGDLVFRDGFEAGDTSRWAQTVTSEPRPCASEPDETWMAYRDFFAGPSCSIQTPGDTDLFRFTAASGEMVWVRATSSGGALADDVCITLYGPDGQPTPGGARICAGTGVEVLETVSIPGVHTVLVEASAGGLLPYGIALERVSPPLPAMNLGFGETVVEDLAAGGDMDTFGFAGSAGDVVRVQGTDQTGTAGRAICVALRGPDGRETVSGAMSCADVTRSFDETLALDGTHTIMVREDGGASMAYSVTVQCIAGDCMGQEAARPQPEQQRGLERGDAPGFRLR